MCIFYFIFLSNLVSCVVSTQDDYFKSWAPAKSLDQGGSSCFCLSSSNQLFMSISDRSQSYHLHVLCLSVLSTQTTVIYSHGESLLLVAAVAVLHWSRPSVCILMKLTSHAHLLSPVCLAPLLVSCAHVPAHEQTNTPEHFGGLIVLQLFEQQQQQQRQTFRLAVTESLLAGFCICSTGTVTLGGSTC